MGIGPKLILSRERRQKSSPPPRKSEGERTKAVTQRNRNLFTSQPADIRSQHRIPQMKHMFKTEKPPDGIRLESVCPSLSIICCQAKRKQPKRFYGLLPERHGQNLAFGRGITRAEDAEETPTQSHISSSILVYEEKNVVGRDLFDRDGVHQVSVLRVALCPPFPPAGVVDQHAMHRRVPDGSEEVSVHAPFRGALHREGHAVLLPKRLTSLSAQGRHAINLH